MTPSPSMLPVSGEQHEKALKRAAKAIHSGQGCTCRRGSKGDAADAITDYFASLAAQGVRLVDARDGAEWLRELRVPGSQGTFYDAMAKAFLARFGGGDDHG